MMASTHELDDGSRVRLRLARPSDAPRVRAFLERLSPETRRRRFFSPMPHVSEQVVRHFTFFDPRERLVMAATAPVEGVEEIVGLADLVRLQTGVAELGVVVDDGHRHRGLGRLLTEGLASLARRRGATHLRAELLEENAAMRALMHGLGPCVHTVEDGVSVIHVKLPELVRRAA
jgi:RimJ/RimL family protein N-acetyltransferase